MKAKEFIIELKKESKPRNFVAKNASLAGKAGQHKDKKKAEKQGDVKHKKELATMESVLSELSTEKLSQYKKAAGADAKKADADGNYSRGDKRFKGINRATNKQFDNDAKKSVAEAFENDESNIMYRYNPETGRLGQRMIHNDEERAAHQQGYRDSHEAALKVHGIIKSKFKPGKWVQKQGNSWPEVHPFGKPGTSEDVELDEINWKKAAATGALALGALGAMGNGQAADLSYFNTQYLQQVASGEHPRPMVSVDDAKAELQARANGKQQATTPATSSAKSGYSKEYLQKAADPDRFGRYLISVEKAQELLKQMDSKVGEGSVFAGAKVGHKEGPAGQWRNDGAKKNKPARPGDLVGDGM